MNSRVLLLTLVLLGGCAAVLFFLPREGGWALSKDKRGSIVEVFESEGVALKGEGDVEDGLTRVLKKTRLKAELPERRDTAAEMLAVREKLREMQRTDDEGLEVVTMPDGHRSIDLQGRFQHVTRLVVAEDGTLVPACVGYLPEEVPGE